MPPHCLEERVAEHAVLLCRSLQRLYADIECAWCHDARSQRGLAHVRDHRRERALDEAVNQFGLTRVHVDHARHDPHRSEAGAASSSG